MKDRKNIILLSIDALRADHVSYHGYERNTTPFLDSLHDDATTFSNAFSASSHTREAVPSLITGYKPHAFAGEGYRLVRPSLADRLSDSDYSSAAFHSNPYISRAYGYDSGFDTFDDDLLLGQHRYIALAQRVIDKFLLKKGEYHARAEDINRKSLDWIDSNDGEPFFLWNHYMDVHGPYNPPEGYQSYQNQSLSNSEAQSLYQKSINEPEAVTESERDLLIELYNGEIEYLDAQLKQFMSALEERRLRQNSIIIITSDHGDAFGEYGYFTHPREIHDILLHVPLLILHPDCESKEINSVVSLLDVVPTVLDCLELSKDSIDGRSLLYENEFSEEHLQGIAWSGVQGLEDDKNNRLFSLRDDEWKVVIKRNLEENDLVAESGYYVGEGKEDMVTLEDVESSRLRELQEELRVRSKNQTVSIGVQSDQGEEINEEISERLEALGYK